ncbi:hypothetical protein [Paracoccus litorisediminis]|uniref:Uncharacterized protein n=1 Tax=Paracoccus litorisediminis TaxID=2006130 RepID=A0A844HSP2_9RHOB|nr:hypothetical protein [Paracoccus litorisediminis]MTH61454.1 hypothetical protein [Paracoccus litorisediminis]
MTTDSQNDFVAARLYEAHGKLEQDSSGIVLPWGMVSDGERQQWRAAAVVAREILIPIQPKKR